MSARRTKASRRAAFRAWALRFAPQTELPVWVVRLDPRTMADAARRMKRALRDLSRAFAVAGPKARAVALSLNLPGGPWVA